MMSISFLGGCTRRPGLRPVACARSMGCDRLRLQVVPTRRIRRVAPRPTAPASYATPFDVADLDMVREPVDTSVLAWVCDRHTGVNPLPAESDNMTRAWSWQNATGAP